MKKTQVSIIMASSIDGKITLANYEKVKFASEEDKKFLMKKRSECDCIIMGSLTVKKGSSSTTSSLIKEKSKQPLNVLISSNLNLNPDKLRYFKDNEIKKVIFTTSKSPIKKRKDLRRFSEIIIVKKDKNGLVDVTKVYETLVKRFGCKKILIEGGGLLNKSFIEKNLVDDLYLTICPIIISDIKARSFVEGEGLTKEHIKKLKLLNFKRNKSGELFLHYKFEKENTKWEKKGINWRLVN